MLRIKFHVLFIAFAIIAAIVYNRFDTITHEMEKNRKESSANLAEHVQSISNIASDASNMERLNRWSCAWRMFLSKPVFGWGQDIYVSICTFSEIQREDCNKY